jgi:hypothetical protein
MFYVDTGAGISFIRRDIFTRAYSRVKVQIILINITITIIGVQNNQ